MTMPIVELVGVTHKFGDSLAVDNLSISAAPGEIVSLLGRTGAGKSTILNLIMGTMPPTAGRIWVAGFDPFQDFKVLRGKLAVSFQTDRLLPWRNAVENAELGLLVLGSSSAEARRKATAWLARVGLRGAENKYVHELSGGMRQRVSLARALAVDPELVLLDESFSQLDHVTSAELRTDFGTIARAEGKTCLLVTHRIDDAVEMSDHIIVLTTPGRIALEVMLDETDRKSDSARTQLRSKIAKAMDDSDASHRG